MAPHWLSSTLPSVYRHIRLQVVVWLATTCIVNCNWVVMITICRCEWKCSCRILAIIMCAHSLRWHTKSIWIALNHTICFFMIVASCISDACGMRMSWHFTDGAIWPSVNLHCTITLVAPWTLLASWAHLSEACSLTAQMEPLLLLRIVLPIGEIMAHNTFQELLILMLQKDGLAPHHL